MGYGVAVLAGLAFGAADQYLGSRSALGGWAAAVSGLSAPWLIVPFAAGMTQVRARRAMALGLIVTLSALAGYFAMTYSPFEGVPLDRFDGVLAMVRSGQNPLWIVGGLVIGPSYGYFGHRWRVARSWVGAALVTVALCLEPLARRVSGTLPPHPVVWGSEIAVGIAAGTSFVAAILIARSPDTRRRQRTR